MRHRRQHLQAAKAEVVSPEKVLAIEPLHDFDWKTAPKRQLRPFKPTYHITMGMVSSQDKNVLFSDCDRSYSSRYAIRTHHN